MADDEGATFAVRMRVLQRLEASKSGYARWERGVKWDDHADRLLAAASMLILEVPSLRINVPMT